MASSDEAVKSEAASTKAEGPRGTPARRSVPAPRPGGPEALIGMTLSGRYKIEKLLGEGGMGAVYQAEHTHMRKRLAIKVLHPEMSRLTEVVARFEREAMAAANIDHPNVAKATDFGKLEDGSFFLALEFVEGHSLREAIGRGRLELGRALHITSQVASALGRAHQLNIVHRDLKPENVMLVERDGDANFVKVLDFGIAKVPVGELGSAGETGVNTGPAHPVLTQLGMVYGTPEYMAPEQALGQEVDARADLYALGIMMYEMLTGERPFDHESKVALLGMHVTAPVPPFSERAPDARIPREVEAITTRLLAKEAAHRFADARELVDAIGAIEQQLVAHGIIQSTAIVMPAMSGPMSGPMSGALSGQARPPLGSGPKLLSADASSSYPSIDGGPPRAGFHPPALGKVGSGVGGIDRRVLIAGVAAVVFFVLVGVGIVIGVSASTNSGGGATSASASSTAPSVSVTASVSAETPMVQVSIDAEIAAARANVEKGNYASAVDSLVPLEERFPQRGDIHQLLEKAYAGAKNPAGAMREAALWIDTDPAANDDLKLLEDVRNAALLGKDGSDIAFTILEEKLGATGTDILYDVGWLSSGQLYPAAAAHARASLAKPAVRAIASRPLQVLLDFRDARTCDAKRALLERARDDGDARMLAQLKLYTPTSGCGFLRRHDCFPCLHRDRALAEAIAAIDARNPKK
jgi:serine/threonine-protein kinase